MQLGLRVEGASTEKSMVSHDADGVMVKGMSPQPSLGALSDFGALVVGATLKPDTETNPAIPTLPADAQPEFAVSLQAKAVAAHGKGQSSPAQQDASRQMLAEASVDQPTARLQKAQPKNTVSPGGQGTSSVFPEDRLPLSVEPHIPQNDAQAVRLPPDVTKGQYLALKNVARLMPSPSRPASTQVQIPVATAGENLGAKAIPATAVSIEAVTKEPLSKPVLTKQALEQRPVASVDHPRRSLKPQVNPVASGQPTATGQDPSEPSVSRDLPVGNLARQSTAPHADHAQPFGTLQSTALPSTHRTPAKTTDDTLGKRPVADVEPEPITRTETRSTKSQDGPTAPFGRTQPLAASTGDPLRHHHQETPPKTIARESGTQTLSRIVNAETAQIEKSGGVTEPKASTISPIQAEVVHLASRSNGATPKAAQSAAKVSLSTDPETPAQSNDTPLKLGRPVPPTVLQSEASEPRPLAPFGLVDMPEPERATTVGALRPGPVPSTVQSDLARSVVQQMSAAITQGGDGTIDVRLSPEDLGRVRLAMTPTDTGITVTITAERADTMDLLRRHIDMFAQDLKQNGFQNLSFAFGKNSHQPEVPQTSGTDEGNAVADDAAPMDPAQTLRPGVAAGRLDLRL